MSLRRSAPTTRSLVILAIATGVLYLAREVLIPFAFALFLSFLLTPLVYWLQKLRLGRIPAVLIAIALSLAAAGGMGWVVSTQVFEVAKDLPQYRLNIRHKIEAMRIPKNSHLARLAESLKEIESEISAQETTNGGPATELPRQKDSPTPVQVVERPKDSLQYLREAVSPFLRFLATLGIIVIFTMFILINREDLRNKVLRLVGLRRLNVVTQAFDDATQRVSRYLLMQFAVNVGFGASIGAGLYFIGVPSPVLWGVVAGIVRIVPYVGSLIATALPLALSLAVFDSWLQPLLVFLLFALLELIVGNFIEPLLYGNHTGTSSLALLVATVFWALLWGPAGLILSTPLTVCVVVLGRYVPQLVFLHILLGDEAVLGPDAQLFQRLLAQDLEEAREVVDAFLKGKPLIELYDQLFIPALAMAEQDRHKGALDPVREEFIFLSMNEMIAEFSNYKAESEETVSVPEKRTGGRVICLAANDHADEIAAAMLAQILAKSSTSNRRAEVRGVS